MIKLKVTGNLKNPQQQNLASVHTCNKQDFFLRSRPSWSPDRHKSRSPIKEIGGKRKKRSAVDLPPEEKEECESLPTIQEEEKSKSVSKEEELEEEEDVKAAWVRSAPADLYYQRDEK